MAIPLNFTSMNQSSLLILAVGIACLALNIVAIRRIQKSDEYSHHKAIQIIFVWIVPIFGAILVLLPRPKDVQNLAQQAPAAENLPTGFLNLPAPELLQGGKAKSFPIAEHMMSGNGFPILDWAAFEKWRLDNESEGEITQSKIDAQRAWLLHMKEVLGYFLYEGKDAFVLSPLEPRITIAAGNFVSTARARITRILDHEIARFAEDEKSILIVFEDDEMYYNYVACYYPEEGEFAFSGGMFIKMGMGHFVTTADHLANLEPVIAHELTHNALAYLHLPLWLDEGMAVNTERLVIGGTQYMVHTSHEIRRRQDAFWNEESIQEFWEGGSFHRPDDGNPLSYELARILVEQMNRDWGAFVRFLTDADRSDAGAAAAREHLGIDLGNYVCALLERIPSAEWAPNPQKWVVA